MVVDPTSATGSDRPGCGAGWPTRSGARRRSSSPGSAATSPCGAGSRLSTCGGSGLEIGALQMPLRLPAGASVRYVDRFDVEELRSHYPELDDFELVAPDVIDDGEVLGTIPDESADFLIANHMIEHCEDPIGHAVQPSAGAEARRGPLHGGARPALHLRPRTRPYAACTPRARPRRGARVVAARALRGMGPLQCRRRTGAGPRRGRRPRSAELLDPFPRLDADQFPGARGPLPQRSSGSRSRSTRWSETTTSSSSSCAAQRRVKRLIGRGSRPRTRHRGGQTFGRRRRIASAGGAGGSGRRQRGKPFVDAIKRPRTGQPVRRVELPVPQLEHEQRPQTAAVIALAGRVLFEQTPDLLLATPAALQGWRVEQHVVRVAPEILAEPARRRAVGSHAWARPAPRRVSSRAAPCAASASSGGARPSARPAFPPPAPSARDRAAASGPRASTPSSRCRSWRAGHPADSCSHPRRACDPRARPPRTGARVRGAPHQRRRARSAPRTRGCTVVRVRRRRTSTAGARSGSRDRARRPPEAAQSPHGATVAAAPHGRLGDRGAAPSQRQRHAVERASRRPVL